MRVESSHLKANLKEIVRSVSRIMKVILHGRRPDCFGFFWLLFKSWRDLSLCCIKSCDAQKQRAELPAECQEYGLLRHIFNT